MGIFKSIGKLAKGALSVIAPTLASALPGPLGKIAKGAVTEVLGLDPDSNAEEIERALVKASPELLLQLKAADNEFKLKFAQLEIDVMEVNALDRANARAKEIATKDWVPKALAAVVVTGFIAVQYPLLSGNAIPTENRDLIMYSFGIIASAMVNVFNYYFGSSAGSAAKTHLLAQQND